MTPAAHLTTRPSCRDAPGHARGCRTSSSAPGSWRAACRFPRRSWSTFQALRLSASSTNSFSIVLHRFLARDLLDPLELVAGARHVEVGRAAPCSTMFDQVGLANDVVGGEDRRAVHRVLAARAHCPASRSSSARSSRLRRTRSPSCPSSSLNRLEEVEGERRNVVAALAQRRHVDRKDVDAVDRGPRGRCPSATIAFRSLLVAVISRTLAVWVLVSPTARNSRSWSTRSSLAWVDSGDVADLVEEQRAAVGDLEHALLVRHRAGERALDVAEQLALQQVLAQRVAVDRRRTACPCAGCCSGWRARSVPCRCRSRR